MRFRAISYGVFLFTHLRTDTISKKKRECEILWINLLLLCSSSFFLFSLFCASFKPVFKNDTLSDCNESQSSSLSQTKGKAVSRRNIRHAPIFTAEAVSGINKTDWTFLLFRLDIKAELNTSTSSQQSFNRR